MNLGGRLCAGLLALGPALASAQTPTAPAAAATPAAPYQDRVIEDLPPLPAEDGDAAEYDRSGWPRFLRLETRLGTQPFDDSRQLIATYAISGLLETPNHGALSIDGAVSPRASGTTLTVRQRDLPLPGGWFGHHEAGLISTPGTGLARLPSRVLLPVANLRGLRGEWQNEPQGLQLLAATGEPGQLVSEPAAGFEGLGGRRSVIGAQWQIGGASETAANSLASVFSAQRPARKSRSGWTVSVQREDARDAVVTPSERHPSGRADASGTHLALRHETGDLRTQGQVVRSDTINGSGPASGYWLDTEWDEGPRQHGLSVYRLDPGLGWAAQAMPNDVQGATLRSQWRTRQWSADVSYDWLRSISGRTADGSFASAGARWRIDRERQASAGLALRRFDGEVWNAWGDWRWLNRWGNAGLRLLLGGGADLQGPAQELSYDQEWAAPLGWTLSTSLGFGRYQRQSGDDSGDRLWSAAVAFQAPLGNAASLRGQLGTEQHSNGQHRHNLNLGGSWRLNRHWSLDSQLTRSLGRSATPRPLDPLAPIASDLDTGTSDRSFRAVLRYDTDAGSRSIPLGGKALDGGGRIEGTVFFDANRSGTQDASETGAPGVTVALDNRYAVRTDAQGRFSFPFVAAGPRTVSVRNETLPLPWGVVDDGQVKIDVRLRETTVLKLPVQQSP